jgi:hypothetical protein
MDDDVMIAVDPHKASNTAAVLDPVTKTLIETARFANSEEGYRRLTGFARRWEQRRWAVEGCHGAGRSLAQRLAADGELVLDVPAKLAARVRVYSRGHGRKTDRHDAVPGRPGRPGGHRHTARGPQRRDGEPAAAAAGAKSSPRSAPRRRAGCTCCSPS